MLRSFATVVRESGSAARVNYFGDRFVDTGGGTGYTVPDYFTVVWFSDLVGTLENFPPVIPPGLEAIGINTGLYFPNLVLMAMSCLAYNPSLRMVRVQAT